MTDLVAVLFLVPDNAPDEPEAAHLVTGKQTNSRDNTVRDIDRQTSQRHKPHQKGSSATHDLAKTRKKGTIFCSHTSVIYIKAASS
jgi:hypothetical protein